MSREKSKISVEFNQGYLSKHVNALKGYQTRYFVVNVEQGRLDYFLTKDAFINAPNDYRGCIPLEGAEVAPKEDDSISFNVFSSSGEVFQLKAETAKDRQKWVDAIRKAVQRHNEAVIDPLAVRKPLPEISKGLSGNKKKKALQVPKSALLLPTQEIVNTREAINAAELALNEMSEIIANYPIKVLSTHEKLQPTRQWTHIVTNTTSSPNGASINNNINGADGVRPPAVPIQPKQSSEEPQSAFKQIPHHSPCNSGTSLTTHSPDISNYEAMLRIKAFSVACLQDLKLCFDAIQADYIKARAS